MKLVSDWLLYNFYVWVFVLKWPIRNSKWLLDNNYNVCVFFYRNGLYELASEAWAVSNDETRQKMSVMATAAAWGLGQWETMEEYIRCIPKGSFDEPFYQALLHIHNQKFLLAQDVRIEIIY